MFEAAGSLNGWFTALRASPVPLHSQLVLALAGNRQLRKLILNSPSHVPFSILPVMAS